MCVQCVFPLERYYDSYIGVRLAIVCGIMDVQCYQLSSAIMQPSNLTLLHFVPATTSSSDSHWEANTLSVWPNSNFLSRNRCGSLRASSCPNSPRTISVTVSGSGPGWSSRLVDGSPRVLGRRARIISPCGFFIRGFPSLPVDAWMTLAEF